MYKEKLTKFIDKQNHNDIEKQIEDIENINKEVGEIFNLEMKSVIILDKIMPGMLVVGLYKILRNLEALDIITINKNIFKKSKKISKK